MRRGIPPCSAVADLLRSRRLELGLSLREVESQTGVLGETIPITVIARVERGAVDPGFRRLNVLLRLYDIPLDVAGGLADLEQFAGALPADPAADYQEAIRQWKAGDLRLGMAHLLALKTQTTSDPATKLLRQKALLAFGIAAGSLGRYRLSRNIVDELLLEPPEPSLLVPILTQAAACWHRLGSSEVALALLGRAESHVAAGEHQKLAWICHNRASTLVTLGQFAEGRAELGRARMAYRAAKDTHGEGLALGVLVRLAVDRGALDAALVAAREAHAFATKHGHDRLRIMRRIDEGRILIALKETQAGIAALNDGLAGAIAMQDGVSQFHAHFHLWKAHGRLGDAARADLELRAAQYYVRFLDDVAPEATEVRQLIGRGPRADRRRGANTKA